MAKLYKDKRLVKNINIPVISDRVKFSMAILIEDSKAWITMNKWRNQIKELTLGQSSDVAGMHII